MNNYAELFVQRRRYVGIPGIRERIHISCDSLVQCAIDCGKQDIAKLFANLGADLSRREIYEKQQGDGTREVKVYTPSERAAYLEMTELAELLTEKQKLQQEKLKSHIPLMPRRALQKHFNTGFSTRGSSVFITQSMV